MSNRVVALWVPESDITSGYFVLSDVVTKLPKDVAIIDGRSSYSSAHYIFRLYSKEFPEVPLGNVSPAVYFKYNVNDGMRIEWPTKEYEDIMLKQHGKTIEETVNRDAEVMESEGGIDLAKVFEVYAKAKAVGLDGAQVVVDAGLIKGCQHQWFMYGRTSSHKHCKQCGAMQENIVDKD